MHSAPARDLFERAAKGQRKVVAQSLVNHFIYYLISDFSADRSYLYSTLPILQIDITTALRILR